MTLDISGYKDILRCMHTAISEQFGSNVFVFGSKVHLDVRFF